MSSGAGKARTWNIGGVGTHGNDPDYISQNMDTFIVKYLRANEKDCK